jgi:hypothetical protein
MISLKAIRVIQTCQPLGDLAFSSRHLYGCSAATLRFIRMGTLYCSPPSSGSQRTNLPPTRSSTRLACLKNRRHGDLGVELRAHPPAHFAHEGKSAHLDIVRHLVQRIDAALAVARADFQIQVEFVALRFAALRLPIRQRPIARRFGMALRALRLRVGQNGGMRNTETFPPDAALSQQFRFYAPARAKGGSATVRCTAGAIARTSPISSANCCG